MDRNHYGNPFGRTTTQAARMQTASSRVSFDAERRNTNLEQNTGWATGPDFDEPGEPTEQSEQTIELPFSPDDREKEDIHDALTDISSFQVAEKERIYRHAKDLYLNEVGELDSRDIIDVCQVLEFAKQNDHDDWEQPLEDTIQSFFEGIEESPVFVRPGSDENEQDMGASEIREAFMERQQRMRDSIAEVYGSPDEERNSDLISESQKSYLWILLQSSDQFNNLLPE